MFRMTRARLGSLFLLVVAGVSAGCGNNDEALFGPTPVIPDPTTVVVSGSISRNGAFTHPFVSQSFGTVQATLLSLAPDPEVSVGVALGTWNGAACQVIIANDRALVGTSVVGNVSSVGTLCLRVYDAAGTLPGTVSFDVQIVHP
jgi:hypothetical protein